MCVCVCGSHRVRDAAGEGVPYKAGVSHGGRVATAPGSQALLTGSSLPPCPPSRLFQLTL